MDVDKGFDQKSDVKPQWMAAHACLKIEFTEGDKYHYLMSRLKLFLLVAQDFYTSQTSLQEGILAEVNMCSFSGCWRRWVFLFGECWLFLFTFRFRWMQDTITNNIKTTTRKAQATDMKIIFIEDELTFVSEMKVNFFVKQIVDISFC